MREHLLSALAPMATFASRVIRWVLSRSRSAASATPCPAPTESHVVLRATRRVPGLRTWVVAIAVATVTLLPAGSPQAGILEVDAFGVGQNFALFENYTMWHEWFPGLDEIGTGTTIASTVNPESSDPNDYNEEWGPQMNQYYEWTVYNGVAGVWWWRFTANYFTSSGPGADVKHLGTFTTP